MLDYIAGEKKIESLYHRFPSIDNFEAQIKEKSDSYSQNTRSVLVSAIENQYKDIDKTILVEEQINNLKLSNTYTITTGHQLNLFSGPLYFLYKIISIINLCKELKEKYPDQNFVPIYWMASEDHDFEEIQYFNFKDKKYSWNKKALGPVGRLDTEGLKDVYKEFSEVLNSGKHANELRDLFKEAYLNHTNLGDASRYLVNALFGAYGLVIVDGDDKELKSLFKPYAVKELEEQISFKNVTETNIELKEKGYKCQVNPREINLFYIGNGFRERIIKEGNRYLVHNTDLVFSSSEALFENSENLEFVSGNALLRPLYQEVILPNLCYVGGGGELAYWMQLKSTFYNFKVPFPILLLRNSALVVSKKQQEKAANLKIEIKDLFLSQHKLIDKKVKELSTVNFDFESKRKHLMNTFGELEELASQTDKSFIGAVRAQQVKQIKGLNTLEKRLLRAEKKKMHELANRIKILQNELFPNNSLEERQRNFSDYYEVYGDRLITSLLLNLKPLKLDFTIIDI